MNEEMISDEKQLSTSPRHVAVYIEAETPKYFLRKHIFTACKQSHLLKTLLTFSNLLTFNFCMHKLPFMLTKRLQILTMSTL